MESQQRDLRHDVLGFVARFVRENGYAPTYAEIREAVGLSSKSHVAYYLGVLERDGYIQRRPRSPRSLGLVRGRDGTMFGQPFDAWSPGPIYGASRQSCASSPQGTDHDG